MYITLLDRKDHDPVDVAIVIVPNYITIWRSRSLQNLVAVSQRYCQPLLTIKAGCIGSNGKNWILNPESSSQSEGYSSKWLIWLVVREPLTIQSFIQDFHLFL